MYSTGIVCMHHAFNKASTCTYKYNYVHMYMHMYVHTFVGSSQFSKLIEVHRVQGIRNE